MSEEMKMSDVFDNDVRHFGGGSIGDDRCDEFALAKFEDSIEAEYACHAINNHDTLTEQVRQLQHENKDLRNGLKVANGTNKKAKRQAITELLALHEQDRAKVNSQCDTLINMSTVRKYLEGL